MAKIAQLPDGTKLEFPDDVSPEVMDRVVRSHLNPEAAQAPQPAAPQPPRQSAAPGAQLRIGPFNTGLGLSPEMAETLAGAGRRMADIFTLGNRPTQDDEADKALDQSGYATAGSVAADLTTLLGGGAALRAAGAVPQLAKAAPAAANVLRTAGQNMVAPTSVRNAALTAGAYGAATQNGDLEDRATTGATSALFGAAGQALPNVLGAVIKPRVAPDVADLASRGIRLTPGQRMGGAMNTAEQKAMSIPVLGDAIAGARRRGIEDFNRAVADDVLAPLGVKSTAQPGRELIRETQDAVAAVYDDVLPRLSAQQAGMGPAISEARKIAAEVGKTAQFDEVVKNRLLEKFGGQPFLTGEKFKEADSLLGEFARNMRSSGDGTNLALAKAIDKVKDGLRASVQGAPEDISKLKAADAAYARLVRMETAAAFRGAKDGIFTPANFGNAVERGASRKTKAAGREMMGEFADAAERRLSTNFPNSGTADRLLLGGGLLGAGYAADVPPEYLALGGLGAAAYSRPGQAAIRGLLARPNSQVLEDTAQGARALAPAGGLLAPYLLPVYASQQ